MSPRHRDSRVDLAARREASWLRRVFVLASLAISATVLSVHDLVADEGPQRPVRIGFVGQGSAQAYERYFSAFREQLGVLGYVEGKTLEIEARWADGDADRLPALMTEVVERRVDLIITAGTPSAFAAKNATSTVPIVVVAMGDPVRSGLVNSLARPGGNLTGLSMGYSEGIAGKWLELLQETVPRLSVVAVITHPGNPWERDLVKYLKEIAPKKHLKVHIIELRQAQALDHVFEEARHNAQAAVVFTNAITGVNGRRIAALAATSRLPVMYSVRMFVDEGGLMTYAPDLNTQYRRAAEYADKILKGANPADLPIEQPTRYIFVVNLRAAKALGFNIPPSVLLRADEIIR